MTKTLPATYAALVLMAVALSRTVRADDLPADPFQAACLKVIEARLIKPETLHLLTFNGQITAVSPDDFVKDIDTFNAAQGVKQADRDALVEIYNNRQRPLDAAGKAPAIYKAALTYETTDDSGAKINHSSTCEYLSGDGQVQRRAELYAAVDGYGYFGWEVKQNGGPWAIIP